MIATTLATQAGAAQQLTLREAMTLPPSTLATRVLGEVGSIYLEVRRPILGGIPGRRGFDVEFATAPRSAGFPGLCEADTITVYFGTREPVSNDSIIRLTSVLTGKVYRIVSDTAPVEPGWSGDDGAELAARCANSGPVLPVRGAWPRPFFSGRYNSSSDFWAAHAYSGARALSKARSAVAAHVLRVAECREDSTSTRQSDRICSDPAALLRSLQMERFLGFDIARCSPEDPYLCVTATFARTDAYDRIISIRMRTSMSEILGPPPDFEIREVRIEANTPVS